MKMYVFLILVGLTTMSYNTNIRKIQKTNVINQQVDISKQDNQEAIQAYVKMRNEWLEGYVFVTNGYVTRCQFPDINDGRIRAQMYEPKRPSRLNPDNPIAVQNSFTHYIDIPNYGRAYFSL